MATVCSVTDVGVLHYKQSRGENVLISFLFPSPPQTSIDVTETFKQQKGKLVLEGFSPEAVQDPLYFLDVSQKDYIPLTQAVFDDILSGKIRL